MSGWRRRTGRTVGREVGPKRGQPGAPDRPYLSSLVRHDNAGAIKLISYLNTSVWFKIPTLTLS